MRRLWPARQTRPRALCSLRIRIERLCLDRLPANWHEILACLKRHRWEELSTGNRRQMPSALFAYVCSQKGSHFSVYGDSSCGRERIGAIMSFELVSWGLDMLVGIGIVQIGVRGDGGLRPRLKCSICARGRTRTRRERDKETRSIELPHS